MDYHQVCPVGFTLGAIQQKPDLLFLVAAIAQGIVSLYLLRMVNKLHRSRAKLIHILNAVWR